MITKFNEFIYESTTVQPYPSVCMTAINNTKGAEVLNNGDIKLMVSRYQKPEQSGELSIRTGVFYMVEQDSTHGRHFRNRIDYGGSQYITGTLICHKPYIVKAGIGGMGSEIAYKEVMGKDKYNELMDDLYISPDINGEHKVLAVRDVLDKYNGYEEEDNYDMAYNMVRISKEIQSNRLRTSLQENIIAHALREKGYDSILSYGISKGQYKLSEVFYLEQEYYPEDSSFILEGMIYESALYSNDIMQAIDNTPGAKLLNNGHIKLDVERYQKDSQRGKKSIRNGVFYTPEYDSEFARDNYSNNNDGFFGGGHLIKGVIVCKRPYIIEGESGGIGPQNVYRKLFGKQRFEELYNEITFFKWEYKTEEQNKTKEHIVELFKKYGGDHEIIYELIKNSDNTVNLFFALIEHIIGYNVKKLGYDSILTYQKYYGDYDYWRYRFVELFYLRQDYYPEVSGFVIEGSTESVLEGVKNGLQGYIKPRRGFVYVTQDISYARSYANGFKITAQRGETTVKNGVIFVIWLDDNDTHWGGDIWRMWFKDDVLEALREYKASGVLPGLLDRMFDVAGLSPVKPSPAYIDLMIKDPVKYLLQRITPSEWSDIQEQFGDHSEIALKKVDWNQIIEIQVYEAGELTDVIPGGKDIDLDALEPEDTVNIFYHGSPLHLWKEKLL